MRVTYNDIFIERGQYGQYVVSALIDGYWWHKQYFYYTKKEALRDAHATLNAGLEW